MTISNIQYIQSNITKEHEQSLKDRCRLIYTCWQDGYSIEDCLIELQTATDYVESLKTESKYIERQYSYYEKQLEQNKFHFQRDPNQ